MKKTFTYLVIVTTLTACASTPPTKIGANTYYSAKTNTAGAFGNVSTVAGSLMAEGYQFCGAMGKEFELVTQTLTPPAYGAGLGGASITFKCVDHANNPVLRPDNGVSTIEAR